jgi:hypothetical protein
LKILWPIWLIGLICSFSVNYLVENSRFAIALISCV